MKTRILLAAPALLLAAACSQSAEDEALEGKPGSAAEVLSGAEGFAIAANCYSQLGAVSRLFSALAEQSTGTERQELADRALSRELAANQYQLLANRLAAEIGQPADVSDQAFKQAEAAIQREFDTREFEDFAVWVGNEADKCPPQDVG